MGSEKRTLKKIDVFQAEFFAVSDKVTVLPHGISKI